MNMSIKSTLIAFQAIKEVKEAKTPNQKMEVLNEYSANTALQTILYYTYNPYLKYGITKKVFEKYKATESPKGQDSLYSLLDELAASNINDSLRQRVVNFISMFSSEFKEIMIGIMCKDLKLGISQTTINKVWPELIPTFELQLAARYQNVKLEENEHIWVTEKFDGIRCVCIIENGTIKFMTRQGKEIKGLLDIEESIKKTGCFSTVIDGELLYNGECKDSAEQYKKTTKIVNSKMEDKKDIAFNVFDIISLDEFKKGESSQLYEFRRTTLDSLPQSDVFKVAPVLYEGTDHSKIMECHREMVAKHKEGVMVNRNATYKCTRTKDLLKVKVMSDMDLRIIGYEEGKGENEGKLGAFIVDYKGNEVNVGSGYSKIQREEFWKNKDMFIGRIIKVQYFEESKNANGGISLRFPVFLELRADKNAPSYE